MNECITWLVPMVAWSYLYYLNIYTNIYSYIDIEPSIFITSLSIVQEALKLLTPTYLPTSQSANIKVNKIILNKKVNWKGGST